MRILLLLLFSASAWAADPPSPCVVIKRMGPADEVTSHLYSFGIRGKQYQYVEGVFPKGMKFHGRLTDHDVREIFDKGGRIAIVEPKYTPADLQQARDTCHVAQEPAKTASASEASEKKPEPEKK